MARVTDAFIEVVDPSSGKPVRKLRISNEADVASTVFTARSAQKSWRARPMGERAAMLRRFIASVDENRDELACVLTRETGKPIGQARAEIRAVRERIDWFLDQAEGVVADEVMVAGSATSEHISYEPLGVVANISAWNYPYFVGSNVFVPALLTGNAVVYKPSEHAAMTGVAIAELMWKAGVPRELFSVVLGGGATGAQLLSQPLDGVFFTGSVGTGRKIAEAAARQLIPAQLELGGKDPVYVRADVGAHLEQTAAAIADGVYYNTGQGCCSVERIYVHRDIYAQFVDVFVDAVDGMTIGDPSDEATYIGPLAREAQLEVLTEHTEDAELRGARLMRGGKRLDRPGYYFAPTVIADANHTMQVMTDESFGPIIGIQEVDDDDEAIACMNDTTFGLTASIFTDDSEAAKRLLAAVDAGTAYWNCCNRISPRLPWSGRRQSGIGSTLSIAGIRAFVQPKAWHLRHP